MTIPDGLNILLEGIVGSTAYGMARPDSDEDRLGVFAFQTEQLFGLTDPSNNHRDDPPLPDRTVHEAGKFARTALKSNPTLLELLWLPDELYVARADLGEALIAIRDAFLSRQAVRDSYCGYARQQFHKLRNDDTFGSDLRKRTEKHARHLARLMHCGLHLLATGELLVQLEEPARFIQFGADVADTVESGGSLDWVESYVEGMTARFDLEYDTSPLPEDPDRQAVADWLRQVRKACL